MAMAQQRMQQNVAGTSAPASIGLADGNTRMTGQSGGQMSSDNQHHPGTQPGGGVGSHDGSNSQVQEPERSSAEGNMGGGDQTLHQTSASNDSGQSTLRRNGALTLVASAFDAAKDIMETLRSKHANLASELEVTS